MKFARNLRRGTTMLACVGMLFAHVAVADEIELQQGASNAFTEAYQGTHATMIIANEWEGLSYLSEPVLHLMGADSDARRRILLRFDLELLKGKVEAVESATLHLYKHLDPMEQPETIHFSVYEISPENAGWTVASWLSPEPGGRWAGAPGLRLPGIDFREPAIAEQVPYSTARPDRSEIAEIPIPPELIERWIEGPNAGLMLMLDEEESSNKTIYVYSAAEANELTVRPMLRIVYRAPIP